MTSHDTQPDGQSDGRLDGQVALVTGGTRGIGLAAARGLGARGATVLLVGRSEDSAKAAATALVQEDIDALGVGCDVGDAEEVAALPGRLGPLAAVDILICAAGVMSERTAKTLRTSETEWRRVMAVDLDGVWRTIAAFVPGMVERRHGRVIAVSACLGRMSGPGNAGGLAPYRVAKAGVNALVRNLAHEQGMGMRGVLVDATCPGHCRTDMGGPDAPRSAEQGAETAVWLAGRSADGAVTGVLWEDREIVPW
ncbi:SDR family NAD(P)-dependent oxidoreductase [Allobranchiibius huperziae]|uniref:NAD(P)-dependent dehydrogenase (Short-subunit alcohol dehydrogenase family) n=1 Tax=Allobranchiibius huperziae TaxID=1874116 RepID=A0A853D8U2_9MICO|nr:SDR family NAD(P)-dependent oxidoreductase [Allobranchiibius huperziae]NYJ73632.1 NAD(P)-dependent dehydrogenase (short-subunit alcohol dehydrogenase family) [Allobranchiibius huperziae]